MDAARRNAGGPDQPRERDLVRGHVGVRQRAGHGYVAGTVALVLHLIGSFLGLLLLRVAAWRSRAFPRPAAGLLVGFLVWDLLLPPLGPVDAPVLLVLSRVWRGLHVLRVPEAVAGRSDE